MNAQCAVVVVVVVVAVRLASSDSLARVQCQSLEHPAPAAASKLNQTEPDQTHRFRWNDARAQNSVKQSRQPLHYRVGGSNTLRFRRIHLSSSSAVEVLLLRRLLLIHPSIDHQSTTRSRLLVRLCLFLASIFVRLGQVQSLLRVIKSELLPARRGRKKYLPP